MMIRLALLLLVPVAPVMSYALDLRAPWVFSAGIVGIAVLAEWIRSSTEQLALHTGPAVGGLLAVSLGSIAELVLAIFVLMHGETEVVHAQITGSIIGTCLLGLGLSIVVGGLTRAHQQFRRARASLLSSLLILAVIALLLPAVFDYTGHSIRPMANVDLSDEVLSLAVSVVLLLIYAANLVYTLVTHRDVFASGVASDEKPRWSAPVCLAILAAGTVAAALESELVSDALTGAASAMHLTPLFLGVIVIALVGTSADIFSAVWFAHRNQMGVVMGICVGSAIQIALVVAPLLVIISWLLGRPMTLVFTNPMDLFSIAGTALIVNSVAGDGETTWFEGILLLGVYFVLAMAYFLA
jgi:Ca2+:H+ antiporter